MDVFMCCILILFETKPKCSDSGWCVNVEKCVSKQQSTRLIFIIQLFHCVFYAFGFVFLFAMKPPELSCLLFWGRVFRRPVLELIYAKLG